MALEASYGAAPAGSAGSGAGQAQPDKTEYWPLSKCRRAYTDYLFSKREEIDEQRDARRYYHGSQYTADQIRVLGKRKQPVMTFNRVARKIDGTVGLIERLRQDPKAFARTPKHEQGAELATAALRYVLDEQEWKAKSPVTAQDGAVDGIGGIEVNIEQGDQGDPEISFDIVDIQSFFYDPRSYRYDFSDARYQGIGKWLDLDTAKEMFPDADASAFAADSELTNNTDREMRWFSQDGVNKRVRVIDLWYKHKGGWCYAIFSGNAILMEGRSYLKDEKKKETCKYIMFSGNVDQDGDRYGFIRNMKSAQDGINAKQSKMQHILASRRLILSQGAVDDVEKVRQEWARPDGVVITNRPVNEGVKSDDQAFDFAGWVKMLELNLNEIENFGPNPALIGQGVENKSGRAIQLLQQAGIAELGPYILAYRGWKIRVYRALWNAVQMHWKGERWIRVTDDDNLAQFIQINGMEMQNGVPAMVNAIGSLDVDIILDEGPDQVNVMSDAYDTLTLLAGKGAQVPPRLLIELAPLTASVKKKALEIMDQAGKGPEQQIQQGMAVAKIEETKASAGLKQAQTALTLVEAQIAPGVAVQDGQQAEQGLPPELHIAKAVSDLHAQEVGTAHTNAMTEKVHHDMGIDRHDAALGAHGAEIDRNQQIIDHYNAEEDRKLAAKTAQQKTNTPA